MGSRGTTNTIDTSRITEQQLIDEANRLGVNGDEILDMFYSFETSSYGGGWDELSDFIEQATNLHFDKGDLYRGIRLQTRQEYENLLDRFERTKVVDSRRDGISWSSDKKIAEEYSKQWDWDFNNSIVFVNKSPVKTAISSQDILGVRNRIGADIDGEWHPESQVIYSNKKSFKITNIKRGKNVSYVYVVEK